ncbi:MAG: EAL domain-containing protein, partial [Pseudomonadota bacterium]|nr:EAL domain-containing protein [Pseudomonadota bacterium]
ALSESESRVRLLLDSVADGVFGVDPDGICTFVNSSALRLLGCRKASELVGKKIGDIIIHTPEKGAEAADVTQYLNEAIVEGKHVRLDNAVMWRVDGPPFDAECRCSPVYTGGAIVGAVTSFRDVTERHVAEERLRQAATVFENTDQGIIVADADRNIVAVNRAFTEITGYGADEVVGRNPSLLQSGQYDGAFYTRLWRTLNRTRQWRGEIWNRRKSGELYPAWQSISLVTNDSGRLSNYIAIFSDISALKESEQRLDHLAHHDALTGLPNRLLLDAKLDQILELARRNTYKVALLFLDLDRFKLINDTMGHSHGDKLLQTIAERLKDSVRAEDTVARLGGDEFIIVLAQIRRPGDAAVLAEKILKAVSTPARIGGQEIVTSTSIGISLFPDDGDNHADLLKTADAAMYYAKESGRQNYRFYTADLTEKAHAHLTIERGLRSALARGEFVLHYQPQVSLFDGHITGVEALIRWRHPKEGLLPPAMFIPVAEETALIDPIGEWVLRMAGADAHQWREAGLSSVRVGVNLSGRQFRSESSLDRIVTILEELDLQPGNIQFDLEVTESTLQIAEGSLEALGRMKGLGATLAIDDFGTGHSSLHRLKHLPIDTLKIDRSFVKDIPRDPDDEAIAEAIIAMGRSLHLKVIAEGVETEAQLAFLRASGCDEMQGFLFSKPVPADRIAEMLAQDATLEFHDSARAG